MKPISRFKASLFVTYSIIQNIIGSEMQIRTSPLNGQCKKKKKKVTQHRRIYTNIGYKINIK